MKKEPELKPSIKEQLTRAKEKSEAYNTERRNSQKPKRDKDLDM